MPGVQSISTLSDIPLLYHRTLCQYRLTSFSEKVVHISLIMNRVLKISNQLPLLHIDPVRFRRCIRQKGCIIFHKIYLEDICLLDFVSFSWIAALH